LLFIAFLQQISGDLVAEFSAATELSFGLFVQGFQHGILDYSRSWG